MRNLPDPLRAIRSESSTDSVTSFGVEAERVIDYAEILLGSFRKGDANNWAMYGRAIVAVLSDYPEVVMQRVVDPRSGIPSRQDFMPTARELKEACEEIYGPIRRAQEWDVRAIQQVQEATARAGLPVPSVSEVQETLAKQGLSVTAPSSAIQLLEDNAERLRIRNIAPMRGEADKEQPTEE